MQATIETQTCAGCRSCEIACSFHHNKVFWRKISSIEVQRQEREKEFGIVIHRQPKDGHLACDCKTGHEFCLQYCPLQARDELKNILRGKTAGAK